MKRKPYVPFPGKVKPLVVSVLLALMEIGWNSRRARQMRREATR